MAKRVGANKVSNLSLVHKINGRDYRLINPYAKYKFPPYLPIKDAVRWADKYRKAGNLVHVVKSTVKGKEYGLLYVYCAYDLEHEKKK